MLQTESPFDIACVPDGRDLRRLKWQMREKGRRTKERLPIAHFNYGEHAEFAHDNHGGKKQHLAGDFRRLFRPRGRKQRRRKTGYNGCCGDTKAWADRRVDRQQTQDAINETLVEFEEYGSQGPCVELSELSDTLSRYTTYNNGEITAMAVAFATAYNHTNGATHRGVE